MIEHEWGTHTSPMGSQLTACRVCGIVKRGGENLKRNGPNKPCKGFVRVELRSEAEGNPVASGRQISSELSKKNLQPTPGGEGT